MKKGTKEKEKRMYGDIDYITETKDELFNLIEKLNNDLVINDLKNVKNIIKEVEEKLNRIEEDIADYLFDNL